jgi:hypothetical protein
MKAERTINGIEYRHPYYKGEMLENYLVSPCGKIYSLLTNKFRATHVSGNTAYPRVGIRMNGKSKMPNVHQLVASAWVKKPIPEGISKEVWMKTPAPVKSLIDRELWEIDHINTIKTDFRAENLRWVSRSKNKSVYYSEQKPILELSTPSTLEEFLA